MATSQGQVIISQLNVLSVQGDHLFKAFWILTIGNQPLAKEDNAHSSHAQCTWHVSDIDFKKCCLRKVLQWTFGTNHPRSILWTFVQWTRGLYLEHLAQCTLGLYCKEACTCMRPSYKGIHSLPIENKNLLRSGCLPSTYTKLPYCTWRCEQTQHMYMHV